MKKTFKIKMIMVMALAMCLSLVLGFTIVSGPSAKVSATTPTTFEMLGMSIRYSAADGDDGIRFGVKLDLATYNKLKDDNNARAGILVTPSDQISGGSLSLSTAVASHAQYGILYKGGDGGYNYWSVEDDYATGIVYLHGFPTESYNRPITAVAYIDWDNDGTDVNHSDTVEISMADVALAAITSGTTAEQAEKLNAYLLNYDVKFLDAYGNVSTQSVKFGSDFDIHADPAAREGYVFEGWALKTGENTYNSPAAITDTTVKYARTYKSVFSTTGSTFEKPALGSSNPKYDSEGANFNKTVTDGELTLRGGFYMDGITVANGADFMVSMTFTAVSGAEYVFMVTDDLASGKGRITFKGNKFNFYNYTSGTYDDKTWDWYDSIENRTSIADALVADTEYTMSLIHKNGKYVVYINDYEAVEFKETESLQSGSTKTVADLVGDGDTLYLGIGSISNETIVSDWRFTTDADTINDFMIMETIGNSAPTALHVTKTAATIGGSGMVTAYMSDVEIAQNQDFVIYARANAGFASHIGFAVGTLAEARNHLLFRWRSNDIYVTRETPNWKGHADNRWTPGYDDNSSDKEIALVYKSGVYYMIMDGEQVWSGDDNGISDGWKGTLDIANQIGTTGAKRIGFIAYKGTTTYNDWGYSTDAATINGYLKLERRGNTDPTILKTSGTSATIKAESGSVVTTYINGAEVAQNQDFVIYAKANAGFASHIGFAVGTLATSQKHMLFSWRSGDIYVWRNDGWKGHADNTYTPGYGSNSSDKEIALVYKSGFYYLFMNGTQVFGHDETTDIGWKTIIRDEVGTEGTKKLGLYTYAGTTTYTDYGYSTDQDVIAGYLGRYVNPAMDSRINVTPTTLNVTSTSAQITTNGNSIATAFFTGVEIAQDQDFVIYAKVNSGFVAIGIGFVVGTNVADTNHLLFQWRNDRIVFWRQAGGWTGYDGDTWKPGYVDNSSAKDIALVYKSGRYYLFMNGTQVFGQDETTDIGWKTIIRDKVGTEGTKKIGLAVGNGNITCSEWGYSTDADWISANYPTT